ncbi:MAG: helix-turn-helix transcriptional regulator [Candidatus Limiplasma sp.]|nr:helix-turn-helix transcriptional regulator [Candidatus Limiplasma sp.]
MDTPFLLPLLDKYAIMAMGKDYLYNVNLYFYVVKVFQAFIRSTHMTICEQIKVLCVRSNISIAELARRLGTTPQNFSSKMKRESFTVSDLESIASVVDCTFERYFVLEDGDKV